MRLFRGLLLTRIAMEEVQAIIGAKRRHNGEAVGGNFVLSTLMFAQQALTRTKKVFIGGLPASTTKESLIEFFSQFGQVSVDFWRMFGVLRLWITLR